MPIVADDIEWRLSGGAANADPNASLGGQKSSTELVDATLNNLFDNVSGDEAQAGDTEYRCIYVHNGHATLTWENVKVWIQTQTPSPDTSVEIALDTSGVGDGSSTGVAESVANESTAPTDEMFSAPADKASGLTIGNLAPGQSQAIWVKRIVEANAQAYNNDSVVIRAEGDTAA